MSPARCSRRSARRFPKTHRRRNRTGTDLVSQAMLSHARAGRAAGPESLPTPPRRVGPILYLQGAAGGRVRLSALIVAMAAESPASLRTEDGAIAAATILEYADRHILRYQFSLPMRRDAWYELGGLRYEVDASFDGDLRIAYVSCNGQEFGDRGRAHDERNVLWRRLAHQHAREPFHLLLHGGDQLYADELLELHPAVRKWADGTELDAAATDEVAAALRQAFFMRYLDVLAAPETAWLMARVPSLAMWDDHDICDGWGSMATARLDSPIGRALFAAARESFLLFQLGAAPGLLPEISPDTAGASLGWHVALPDLHLIAPDLRSERRPDRILGEAGWRALDASLAAVDHGRVLILSSVPPLGPRLSWIEAILHLMPGMHKYEDDLRDQWQSRSHRREWRRFLERLAEVHAKPDTAVTVLSGEIHLATRATFDVPPAPMHQLIASGIAHRPPPPPYATVLGALARFGDSPVPGRTIRLHPLPGRKAIYTPQRNYLILERRRGEWRAWWELEEDGPTPALAI